MGILAQIAGNTADAATYASSAQSLMAQWSSWRPRPTRALPIRSSPTTTRNVGAQVNAFYDKLLKLNLIPASVITNDEAYYTTQVQSFGIPLDSRFVDTRPGACRGRRRRIGRSGWLPPRTILRSSPR